VQSAFAVRRNSLADESKPPHAELRTIIAISVSVRHGKLVVGKSRKPTKHGDSQASSRHHHRDRIARKPKNQPRRACTRGWEHGGKHRSPRSLRQSVEHRCGTKTLDDVRNMVVVTHGDTASQNHCVCQFKG
jgi:hypothetical protein